MCLGIKDVLSASRYIWGRGAQDVKVTVFAMLEAVTALLEQGWVRLLRCIFAPTTTETPIHGTLTLPVAIRTLRCLGKAVPEMA